MGNTNTFGGKAKSPYGLKSGNQSEQKPLQSGYLLKRGFKNFASWKRRYCVLLRDGYFSYYNSKQKMKGSVNFSNLNFSVNRDKKDANKFFVLTSKRTYEFKAANKDEAQQWIAIIEKVIKNANFHSSHSRKSLLKPIGMKIKLMTPRRREFDSDDEESVDKKSISKHKKRRSTAKSFHQNNNRIDFGYFKTNVAEYFADIVEIVQKRQFNQKYDKIEYNDGYDEIVQVLSTDSKLRAIFYKITKNKKFMSTKQYIGTMALIQGSKQEVGRMATELLMDEDNTLIDELMQTHTPKSPSFTFSNFDDTQSVISTLSYFDDASSVVSELSMIGRSMHLKNRTLSKMSPRYSQSTTSLFISKQHPMKSSLLYTDGAFSILEETDLDDDDDNDLVLSELRLIDECTQDEDDEKMHQLLSIECNGNGTITPMYDELDENSEHVQNNDVPNVCITVPQNPAVEVFGNFFRFFTFANTYAASFRNESSIKHLCVKQHVHLHNKVLSVDYVCGL